MNSILNNTNLYQSYSNPSTTSSLLHDTNYLNHDISNLCDQFNDLKLIYPLQSNQYNRNLYKSGDTPDKNYMCHLCFKKDHFIRDCPKVMIAVFD